MTGEQSVPIRPEQLVKLAVVKIREAVRLGPDKSAASGTDLIMIAFATCDRQRWIPDSNQGSTELWARLDDQQREAVQRYLNG